MLPGSDSSLPLDLGRFELDERAGVMRNYPGRESLAGRAAATRTLYTLTIFNASLDRLSSAMLNSPI
jgi:hypothetical protein